MICIQRLIQISGWSTHAMYHQNCCCIDPNIPSKKSSCLSLCGYSTFDPDNRLLIHLSSEWSTYQDFYSIVPTMSHLACPANLLNFYFLYLRISPRSVILCDLPSVCTTYAYLRTGNETGSKNAPALSYERGGHIKRGQQTSLEQCTNKVIYLIRNINIVVIIL